MKYILILLFILLLSFMSTIILCSMTSFCNFSFFILNYFLCLTVGVFLYNIILFGICKLIDNKYDV